MKNNLASVSFLVLIPLLFITQEKFLRTWNDSLTKSKYYLSFLGEQKGYYLVGEKYKRTGEFGDLAKGSISKISLVVDQMDSAFQSKDPNKLFALGRFKYTYAQAVLGELVEVEYLKVEDLIPDDTGQKPIYLISGGTLKSIKEYMKEVE